MCKCHFHKGIFSLNTANIGDVFRFEHETNKRQVLEMNFKNKELFAPPIDNYTGMDERDLHTFHLSTKAIFGEEI